MKINNISNLVGMTLRVIDASGYRLLLEIDNGGGMETNKFILVKGESLDEQIAILGYEELQSK